MPNVFVLGDVRTLAVFIIIAVDGAHSNAAWAGIRASSVLGCLAPFASSILVSADARYAALSFGRVAHFRLRVFRRPSGLTLAHGTTSWLGLSRWHSFGTVCLVILGSDFILSPITE